MDCVVSRALYEHGFTTPVTVAAARPIELLRVLRKTLPHNVPSAALPESNAERLIQAAKVVAKASVADKRKKASEVRKRLRESDQKENIPPPSKKPRLATQEKVQTLAITPWHRRRRRHPGTAGQGMAQDPL